MPRAHNLTITKMIWRVLQFCSVSFVTWQFSLRCCAISYGDNVVRARLMYKYCPLTYLLAGEFSSTKSLIGIADPKAGELCSSLGGYGSLEPGAEIKKGMESRTEIPNQVRIEAWCRLWSAMGRQDKSLGLSSRYSDHLGCS